MLTFPQASLSPLLRRLFCCLRRIRLCTSFGVKLQRHHTFSQTFNCFIFWVLKGSFPFKAPAVNLAASARIKAIIMGHVTKSTKKCPLGEATETPVDLSNQPNRQGINVSNLATCSFETFVLIWLCTSRGHIFPCCQVLWSNTAGLLLINTAENPLGCGEFTSLNGHFQFHLLYTFF